MNRIHSIVQRAAGFAFLAGIATTGIHAQELSGNVPLKFTVGTHSFDPGRISVTPRGSGLIVIRGDNGANSALAQVSSTSEKPRKHTLRFDTSDNRTYRLAGYCIANTGCFATAEATRNPAHVRDTVEVALK